MQSIEAVESAPCHMRGFHSQYDYEASQQAAMDRADELEQAACNTITTAIRRVRQIGQLSEKNVRQILETLGCEMKDSRFPDRSIEAIDTALEEMP